MNNETIIKDLSLAVTAFTLGHSILRIDKLTHTKSQFIFKKSIELEKLIEAYWNNSLKVSPLDFFNNLKTVKSRLYGN